MTLLALSVSSAQAGESCSHFLSLSRYQQGWCYRMCLVGVEADDMAVTGVEFNASVYQHEVKGGGIR